MIYLQALGKDKVANQRCYDLCILKYKPEKIIIIASRDSLKFLPENARVNEVIMIEDENDIKEILEKVEKINFNDKILVNITTGTKAMIAGLTYLAIKNKGKIIYIGGERKENKVITGSEKIYEYDFG